jgi:hypothetical protein
VTRKPNNRASTEYAPGPRKKSAADVSILRIKTILPGSARKRFATAVTQATTASTDVKNPMHRDNEISAISPTVTQYRVGEEKLKRWVTFRANMAAVAILKSRSPTPGPPCGNIEYRRCISLRLTDLAKLEYPN